MRLLAVAATAVLVAYTPVAPGQPANPAAPAGPVKDRVKMDAATKQSVAKAMRWMKDQQAPDGSWGNTAITSFALLAFMANGHLPNQGEYGPEVARGVRYLLACTRDDGYIVGPRGGNMYCHGMAALALTQVYGMTGDEEVRRTLKRAIDLIIRTQNHEGGWRYDPSPTAADISVTIMQVMALRGAKDGGIHVPDRTLSEAVRYINRCYDRRVGGYRYQPFSSGVGYARTAAGVCVLQLSGEYDADEIKGAVDYLERTANDNQHYWYGHYYAAHALNQIGGEVWEQYYGRMKTHLLSIQRPAGDWYDSRREAAYGPTYQTAIAVLILSVPTHYLPIYQK